MVLVIIFLIPLSLLLCGMLLWVVDMTLFDGALSEFLKAWTHHWLDKYKPKEN